MKANRNLKICYMRHLGINESGQKIRIPVNSPILEHINSTGDSASFEDFNIICRNDISSYYFLIHESLLIHKYRPTLNSELSSIPLVLL